MKKQIFPLSIILLAAVHVFAADYYWVGGSGNWSDYANHWATSTGGSTFHTQPPTANDNVFFDANSFTAEDQVVTIDVDAYCANMDWTGATNEPELAGATSRKLYIYGSLTFVENMNFSYAGEVYFESVSTGRTITSAGQIFRRHVYFQGVGGYILQDEFEQIGGFTVYLNNGTLDLNDQTFKVNIFHTYNTNVRTLLLRSSEFIITSSSNSAFYFRGDNFTFDAGTSTIRFITEGANLNHGNNFGSGLAFHNVLFEATTGTSAVSNSPGSFNLLVFNSATGSISGGNVIDSLIFNGAGTISTDGNSINDVTFNGDATINQNGTYGKVAIAGNGTITGNNTFNTLIFSPGKTYTLTSGRNQAVDVFTAEGTCNEPITIQSNSTTAQTTFSKTGGSVTIHYCLLQGIVAAGAATFTAQNSVDLGNNSGWIINQPDPRNLYWVGGTGNWNDPANWSHTTGGPGGSCIPNALDNVFFDANSFSAAEQTVTIVADENNKAYCNNMNWTGALHTPTLAGAATNIDLNIFGSLTLNANMNYTFNGRINFEATESGKTINTTGIVLNNSRHVYFQGEGGGWTLQDALNLGTRTLYLVHGTLSTNNHNITAGIFNSNYTNERTLILGSSEIVLSSTDNATVNFNGNNMTLDAGTSLFRLTGNGTGFINTSGGGLFFHNLICESTGSLTVNIYNLNGGFNDIVFHGTGTNSLRNSNIVNSVVFNGNGNIYDNNNNINNVVFNGDGWIRSTSATSNNVFGHVTMNGGGIINGGNTFGTLILTAGNQYTFQNSQTQTINDDLIANGNEAELIIINSSSAGSQANIHKESGTVTVNYVSLRDNNATGDATFIANNSFDEGNNTGWTINAPGGQDYYWVGGTGNWTDAENWSLSSGGPGGAGVPSIIDNVFFDANSFSSTDQVVTITGDGANNANCLDMDWTGALHSPTLAGASGVNLRIFGSLTLINDMNFTFNGRVNFEATEPGQTITTAGVVLDNDQHVYFQGEGGGWTLQDALNLGTRTLYLVHGTLSTNNHNITAGIFNSNYTNERTLILGSSEIVLSSTSDFTVRFNGTNMTLDAGTSLFRLTGNGTGFFNISGGGLFFHDLMCESTGSNTVNIYNLNGGFNDIVFHGTGNNNLRYSNIVNSVVFNGNGNIYDNNNNINNVVFNGNGWIRSTSATSNNVFGHVTMNGDGTINGGNTFGTLILTAGNQYTFRSSQTQTINDDLIANGNEAELIIINSSSAGSQANIHKESGTVTVNYVSLRDNNATGDATFIANNSFDEGNNTGWTINAPGGTNYYWVGGSGNWTDAENWSLSSGGAGGAGVPSIIDNVFFDANSFSSTDQVVTITGDGANNANCLDMDWTGALHSPTLAGSSGVNLRIFGSLTLINDMFYTFSGRVNFEATEPGQTITTAGVVLDNDQHVYFQGEGGGWTLQDALNLGTRTLYLVHGTLNTNNHNITAGTFNSNYTNERTLILGSSEIVLSSTSSQTVWFRGDNMTLDAGTSLFRLTGNGTGFFNTSGGGLFFHDVILESTGSGTVNVYNLNGGFNDIIFHGTGTNSLRNSNIVNSVVFNGEGRILDDNTINNALFYGDGRIYNNNTFGTIEFTPGKTYTITNGRTQTIINELIAEGTCAAFITIQSSSTTAHTTIIKDSGTVTVSYCNLQGINAQGDAVFVAENCLDNGNNSGWTFTQIPQDLFWVGGTGNWDDVSNWAAESGGDGGYCIPSRIDNVIFDQNSFTQTAQAVWVNVSNAECRDMDWSAATFNPTFTSTSASNNLRIYGSVTLNPSMNFAFSGSIYFEGQTPAKSTYEITMAGRNFNNHVYFNGVGGVWTLMDHFNVPSNDIYMNHGTLNTDGQGVICRRFISSNNNVRSLNMGASVFTLMSTSTQAWLVTGTNFSLDAGTSEIRLSPASAGFQSTGTSDLSYHKVVFMNPGNISTLQSNHHFHEVVFNPLGIIRDGGTFGNVTMHRGGELRNNSTYNGTVKLYGNTTITAANNFSRLLLGAGNTFTFPANQVQTISGRFIIWGSAENTITIQSSTPGTRATISKSAGTVLGNYIQLKDMEATGGATFDLYSSVDNGNNIGWNFLDPTYDYIDDTTIATSEEQCFEATEIITVGGDGKHFTVESGGNARLIAGYKIELLPGTRVHSGGYLLAHVTPYGFFCDTLSTMLAAPYVEEVAEEQFPIPIKEDFFFKAYPNPTTGLFTLDLSGHDRSSPVSIEIMSLMGERVILQQLPAANQYQVNLSDHKPGIYLVRVIQGNQAGVLRIIKQ